MEIILASQSPRRKELLKKIVEEFTVFPSGVDETSIKETDPVRFAREAAVQKAREVGERYPSALVIAADTVVVLNGTILGKPRTRQEAADMLERLSGKKHLVITGVALFNKNEDKLLLAHETSSVTFKDLSQDQIEAYLERNEFLDKAGGYAIQDIGDRFVTELHGDYDNVVGFPVRLVKRLLREFRKPEHIVAVEDIAFPNTWGVGRLEGAAVFIPDAVIGDIVKIRIAKRKKRYNFGKVVGIVEPSPFRTEPVCSHFSVCGGCAFQDLDYPTQLERKENYVLQALSKIGMIEPGSFESAPIIPSPDISYYRNKMEYAFGERNGRIFLGLRERASPITPYAKRTVPLENCLIFSQAVERIFPVVCEFVEKSGLGAYDPRSRKGFFRHLLLREGKATGEVMTVLVTRSGKIGGLTRLAENLKTALPALESFWWVENDRVSDVVDFERKHHLFGKPFIEEKLGGARFRIYPESFFQPNPRAAGILYDRIVENARTMGGRRILGLYCGIGVIEIFLSQAAGEAVGIDSEPMNIRNALENASINSVSNCRFFEGTVENILMNRSFRNFDLLVLDPPRSGISPKALRRILELDINRIIYMSCNPAAFARDVRFLGERGYRLRKVFPADFFPHTPHMEVLGIITK